jgi:tetratricopeptide (TPR) repeat protein
MSRAWYPRRFPAGIPVFAALIALGCLAAAPLALAQDPSTEPRATTIVGGDAQARRCGVAINQGDVSDRAIEGCERALRYPRLSREAEIQIRVNLGVMRMRRGEHELAIQQLDTVIAFDPENAEAHLNRGAALVQLRQFGPAIAAITEAMALGVSEPHKAYFNRGAAREALGDARGAYEDYRTALEIQPDWGPANAELARFARTRRDQLANRLGEPSTP